MFVQYLILISFSLNSIFVSTQIISYYTAYQRSFPRVSSCSTNEYFDTALLQCASCPTNAIQKATDFTQCDCVNRTFYYGVNQGGGSLMCLPCGSDEERSIDGFGCTRIPRPSCTTSTLRQVLSESTLTGDNHNSNSSDRQPRLGNANCDTCVDGTLADSNGQRCSPCAGTTPHLGNPPSTISCCTASQLQGGVCLNYVRNGSTTSFPTPDYLNRFRTRLLSTFFQTHLETALYLCRMNLNSSVARSSVRELLSNISACHLVANIAAMQFYYPTDNSALDLYERFIWQSNSDQIWTSSTSRPAFPFLAYPTSYYSEINNSSYNWIPASFKSNNLMRIVLAKYSSTGQYLGLFNAFDSYIQLCGNAYTDGRAAFTFGTVYNRSCSFRVDHLWNSSIYETVFFDPYIIFTQSSVDQMIPIPVVIRNYRTATTTPNQFDDESQWIYHRRFFLIDRVSGFSDNQLKNVHYAKSIKIFTRLVGGTSYIQPPVIIVEYDELSQSDINQDKIVTVTFASEFQMDLSTHIRDIWIAIGVLSACGILLAIFQTCIWHQKAGRKTVDLLTIGKFFLKLCNVIATVFFIVMAGVSMWWLVFFKRVDTVYFVIPTSVQQASFTSLVVIAFILKTLDILQMIIRQSRLDIFFIDWEKPKSGVRDDVSIWRSYFVANEFNELQTFRRINLTFHLVFVLFLLKVINLEYIASAQPNSNLFPTSADYQATYNGILRVGIAFSMWLATALIQYLIYVTIYQRFIEDRVINFIDLCSLSNISIFILMENLYGYYVHGRSPHGIADVDIKQMLNNFRKEKEGLIGQRGLEPNSDDQMFILKITSSFRSQFDNLVQTYRTRISNQAKKKEEEHESEILMASYRNINEFLCAFIERATPLYTYSIRPRNFIETLIGWQLNRPRIGNSRRDESALLIDKDRNFTDALFVGHENSLFIWNMATFLFIDYFASNYVLAAIITYLLNQFAVKLRLALGRRNLAEKTLIPKNFLI